MEKVRLGPAASSPHTERRDVFTPFNPRGHQTRTWRHLPHWNQPGATYFVTFRLADSLPTEVLARLAECRALSESEQFFWMDDRLDAGSGRCLFSDPRNARMMAATLLNFDSVRYNLGAYAVMPNHVHALVQPLGTESMTLLLHRWKSYSARQLQRTKCVNGAVWQEERFDRIVRDEYELHKFHEYILGNPSAAQLPESTFVIGQGARGGLSKFKLGRQGRPPLLLPVRRSGRRRRSWDFESRIADFGLRIGRHETTNLSAGHGSNVDTDCSTGWCSLPSRSPNPQSAIRNPQLR